MQNGHTRRAHRFHCAGLGCKVSRRRFLDGKDATSTGNLRRHIEACSSWGPEVLVAAEGRTAEQTRESLKNWSRSGNIASAFKRQGKGKVLYSAREHTTNEKR